MGKKAVFITYKLGSQPDFFAGKSNQEIAAVIKEYVKGELPWCESLVKVSVLEAEGA